VSQTGPVAVGGCGSYIVYMNIALRRPFTVEEYLDWAVTQRDLPRTELINGQIVAMTPERVEHIEIKVAAVFALKRAIARAGLPCHALGDGMTVRIDAHTAYEPDALAYCGERLKRGTILARDPIIVVEVLSPTTSHTDTSAKLIGYFKLPSVHHYLIIDPDASVVAHHLRAADGSVSGHTVTSGTIRLDPPGLSIDVSEFFE
jgi:Uma2 family endonuclease